MDFGTMINRVVRAARLDVGFYNEAEADTSLNQEALIVVILVSVLSGVGSFIGGIIGGGIKPALIGLLVGVVLGIVNYYVWSYVTYFVGTRLFGGTADPGELLRVLGYASGPRALGVLSFIPCVGWVFGLVGAIWALATGVIGVREALDFDTTKAILTVIIGWVIVLVISIVVGLVFGIGAAGIGTIGTLFSGQ